MFLSVLLSMRKPVFAGTSVYFPERVVPMFPEVLEWPLFTQASGGSAGHGL